MSLKFGGNLVGLVVAALVGGFFGWFLGWVTTRFRLDQFVIGLALFFAATGVASLLYKVVIGVTLQPPLIPTLDDVSIPLLSSIPVLGPVLFQQSAMVYLAFVVSGLLYWLLYRTNHGLKLRSVGENPKAADSQGVNVARTRIWCSAAGAALMALAGAYLPMTYTGTYTEGMVAGRGWLAIALAFFGGWRPQYILAGSAFFAGMEVLALRVQVGGLDVPHQFISMLPYVATLLVMMFALRFARIPAFLGRNYDRESRTSH